MPVIKAKDVNFSFFDVSKGLDEILESPLLVKLSAISQLSVKRLAHFSAICKIFKSQISAPSLLRAMMV